jgi:uncharacterized protein (DUF1330 family)
MPITKAMAACLFFLLHFPREPSIVRAALNAAGGRSLRTAGGKVVHLEGAASPKRVGIVEWDSLEQAEAFYKSKAYNDLAPQRDKAQKIIRRYAVEVMN